MEKTSSSANSEQKTFRQLKHEGMNTPTGVIKDVVIRATSSVVSEINRIINGEINEVYDVLIESGDNVIVRINHGEENKLEKEQWAIAQCEKAGVPVPHVFLVEDIEVDSKILHICVESKIPGVGLDHVSDILTPEKTLERSNLLKQVGRALSGIHSVPTNGFGVLDKDGNGKFASVAELISGNLYIRKEKILPALNDRPNDLEIVLKAYEILEREAKNYPSFPACLIHNDISPQHILVDGENVSGVIDLEAATGGDPILEFARWDFKYGKEFPLKDILEGYENKEVLFGDFERKLNFWKIYRSFISLRYCINNNKQEGINKSIKGIREASQYFS
jgi:aminoglycoside phosphotransferase (APT) family kinase protein